MYNQLIDYKIQQLSSDQLKQELLSFLDYLLIKQNLDEKPNRRIPKFGCAKGTFKMSDDFDEPLEDFKEYMP